VPASIFVFRAFVCVPVDHLRPSVFPWAGRSSPPGFRLLMVSTRRFVERALPRPHRLRFTAAWSCDQASAAPRGRRTDEPIVSHEAIVPSRDSPPRPDFPMWSPAGAGLCGLRRLTSIRRAPRRTVRTSSHRSALLGLHLREPVSFGDLLGRLVPPDENDRTLTARCRQRYVQARFSAQMIPRTSRNAAISPQISQPIHRICGRTGAAFRSAAKLGELVETPERCGFELVDCQGHAGAAASRG
jgi:hypothetical protein